MHMWHNLIVDNLVVMQLPMRVPSLPCRSEKDATTSHIILINVPHHVVLVDRGIFSLTHAKEVANFHTQ